MLSRVADQLYWMSRYLERAEHTARVLSVSLGQTLESLPDAVPRCQRLFDSLGIEQADLAGAEDPMKCAQWLAFDPHGNSSVLGTISAARENARQVREQISSEMWEQLNRLYHEARRGAAGGDGDPVEFLSDIINGSLLFQGITASTMSRGEGWRFIRLGQFIERLGLLTTMLDAHTRIYQARPIENGALAHPEWLGLLHSAGGFESYAKVWTARLNPVHVVEFLLLDAGFPHSIRFAANQIENSLLGLPGGTGRGPGKLRRLAGKLSAQLDFVQIDEILAAGLSPFLRDVSDIGNQIHTCIQELYITYPIETAIAS